jgi:hypothetical protein
MVGEDPTTLAWLRALQQRFSAVLRTPLDRGQGVLSATLQRYDDELCQQVLPGTQGSARERLATYNRQYWFRLFGVLQAEYRLTSRLMSYWAFNDYASRFILAHPPHTPNLHALAEGFEHFLEHNVPACGVAGPRATALPKDALREAWLLDGAFRRVLMTPPEPVLKLTGIDPAQLAASRLLPSQGLVILELHWPLLELRRKMMNDQGEAPVSLPPALAAAQWWAIFRTEAGHGVLPLEPVQGRLLQLLSTRPVADALATLEAQVLESERQSLTNHAQRWLAESVRFGFWVGLAQPSEEARHADAGDPHD